jgi:hypothetical protein
MLGLRPSKLTLAIVAQTAAWFNALRNLFSGIFEELTGFLVYRADAQVKTSLFSPMHQPTLPQAKQAAYFYHFRYRAQRQDCRTQGDNERDHNFD